MTLTEAISKLSLGDFQLILKNGARSSVLCGYDLETLEYSSYKFVKEIAPSLIKNAKFDLLLFKLLKDRGYNVFEYDIELTPNVQLLPVLCWVLDELERINEMEMEVLNSPPDMKMHAAGVDRLNVFGHLNVIDSLAEGDVTKWETVWMLPYHTVFFKQSKSIVENEIQKKLMKLNTPKKG